MSTGPRRRPDPARALRRWEQQTVQTLRRERWLRVHVCLIALLMLLLLMAGGALLRVLGVESLALRYALLLPLAYLSYLGLLRLWAGWLMGRNTGPDTVDGLDLAADLAADLTLSRGGPPVMLSGGGGDFGGGGASGDFGSALDVAGDVAGGTVKLGGELLDSDEGAVVALPLVAVLAIGALLVALLGVGVFALFGVDVLLAVALEVGLAGFAGGFAWRRQREGWLTRALGKTWRAALAMLVLGVLLGAAIDHWAPQAQSLPQVLRMMTR